MKRLHKQSQSYRFLAGDFVGIPLHHRKHECNKERSRATSFDRYISLRIPWDDSVLEWRKHPTSFRSTVQEVKGKRKKLLEVVRKRRKVIYRQFKKNLQRQVQKDEVKEDYL